jgi:hypothetical protein
MDISLKDFLLKASKIPKTESSQIIVARFQSLVCHDTFIRTLSSVDGVLVIPGGELTDSYREKAEEARLIIAYQYSYKRETYSYPILRDWAIEHGISLIYVEYCSDLTDDDFEGAEIVYCSSERGLTVGELISRIEAEKAPDSIVVYKSMDGLCFANDNTTGGAARKPKRVKSSRLSSSESKAITAKKYLEFLQTLNPEGSIDINVFAGKATIPTDVKYFGENVISVRVSMLTDLIEYYTRLIRRNKDK